MYLISEILVRILLYKCILRSGCALIDFSLRLNNILHFRTHCLKEYNFILFVQLHPVISSQVFSPAFLTTQCYMCFIHLNKSIFFTYYLNCITSYNIVFFHSGHLWEQCVVFLTMLFHLHSTHWPNTFHLWWNYSFLCMHNLHFS